MREGYSVTILKWGEPILTIEHECLSGKPDFTTEEEDAIRAAGEHLKSFIGEERSGDVDPWFERRRCDTGDGDPQNMECMICGAAFGEQCRQPKP